MNIDATEILQKLYESGINFILTSYVPPNYSGMSFKCEIMKMIDIKNPNEVAPLILHCSENIGDAIKKCCESFCLFYPGSEFAKWWKKQKDAESQKVLDQHGFEPVSKEAMQDALDSIPLLDNREA